MSEKPLILIVEDHPYMRDTLVRLVELEGFRAVGVGESRYFLSALKQYRPSVIILDVDLGGQVTGVDLLRYVKSNPNFAHIPVVMHTSESGISTLPEANLADLVLLKPVNPDDIGRLLTRVLKRSQMKQTPPTEKPKDDSRSTDK